MKAENLTELIKALQKTKREMVWNHGPNGVSTRHKTRYPSELLDEAIYDYLKTLNLFEWYGDYEIDEDEILWRCEELSMFGKWNSKVQKLNSL